MSPNQTQELIQCAQEGCDADGLYRAPVDRNGGYQFYCLKHVKIHNRNWNYFKGMSKGEVRAYDRAAATHMKPSWSWGRSPMLVSKFFKPRRFIPPKVQAALELFCLGEDITKQQLKTTYHRLVKRNHPDAHSGRMIYIKKLQTINHSYKVLTEWIIKKY